ncbi:hypothetical protein Tco_1098501, partial [Tanacetum coccineum]
GDGGGVTAVGGQWLVGMMMMVRWRWCTGSGGSEVGDGWWCGEMSRQRWCSRDVAAVVTEWRRWRQ